MFLNRVFVLLFFSIAFTTFSQKKEVKKDSVEVNALNEVVITATRTVRQLSSLPMPVTLISKEQIQKSGTTRLKDILIEQTGINFVTDQSGFTGVQLQGLSAEYTLIMIDGVPLVGRSSGNLDLSRITVNNIKQIEIVKGPSSSLYGSEALGGVINIITEKPKGDVLKGDVGYFVRLGARDELDINTNFVYKKGKFGAAAGINLNSSGGFDLSPTTISKTTEAYQNYTSNLQLTYDFSKKLNIFTSQRYFYETQGENNIQSDWNSNTELRHQINDIWNVNYTFYATQFTTESQFNGVLAEFNQTLIRPEIRVTTALKNSTLITGLGANFDALDRTFFDKKETFNSKYIFAQYDFHPTEKINLIVGARFDNHNKYKSAFSPKISSSYKINDWLSAKASVGYGFKAPDFRQLFFNFNNRAGGYIVLGTRTLHDLYGDEPNVKSIEKDLKPENSIGYNVGFEVKPISDVKININFFRNDINDLINTVALQGSLPNISTGTSVFYYENRDQVFTQGVELDVKIKISDNFNFVGGYQFLDAKDKQEVRNIETGTVFYRKTPLAPSVALKKSDYFGLPNRSKHTANAKLFYQNLTHDFSTNIRAIYRSKYALFDTNSSQNIIDKYDDFVAGNAQINMAIEKTFFDLLNFQLGVDNLFDEKGLENETAFPNNDAVLLVGRNYYGRVRFNF
ncbi:MULTISPECIES: TonB-dependent receptor plug domain-containing protein [unclassified Polaribacter]|uniref:TonB-dependent receptor plug domain-containing protein n=1 Tax=unclassified Polaribacter TaxID=196858 RepID=UPI0011BFC90B|nr:MULTISPECIES: TonB-dependent receptor [unclassified Polaribacter]TXD54433.1 TonB-dependent receptor [Polaribacter sp. IC063]TXD60346.1 TonB-dependent receptor [Polaribacter sp. IC066]